MEFSNKLEKSKNKELECKRLHSNSLFMKKLQTKKAFTIVELIIVITILAILATVWFLSYSAYTSNARDWNRLTSIWEIQNWLNMFKLKNSKFPSAEGTIFSWTINWIALVYVWEFWDNISKSISLGFTPTDPLTKTKYTYGTTKDYKYYQISSIMENTVWYENHITNQTYAWNEEAKVEWNYKWILRYSSWSEKWIANVPSLIFNNTWAVDLLNSWTYFVVNKKTNLPYNLSWIKDASIRKVDWTTLVRDITKSTDATLTWVNITNLDINNFSSIFTWATINSFNVSWISTWTLAYSVKANIMWVAAADAPIVWVCNNSLALSCTAWSAINDNGLTTCWTTRTWNCSWASGWANSWLCSLANAACVILKPQDVFSATTYTGNGGVNTITNWIDFLNNWWLIWTKNRSSWDHWLTYSKSIPVNSWSTLNILNSNNTNIAWWSGAAIDLWTTSWFHINWGAYDVNYNLSNYISYTFRKAPKFFDIVTYVGDGTNARAIPHNLWIQPWLVIIKSTSDRRNWHVMSTALQTADGDASIWLYLNTNAAKNPYWASGIATSTNFKVRNFDYGSPLTVGNASWSTYIAYVFAHDPDTTNWIIQEWLFTTDASWNANVWTIWWEPQYIMMKASSTTGDWITLDQTRGWWVGADKALFANTTWVENTTTDYWAPNSTWFTASWLSPSATYIYMVIRKAY